MSKIDGGIRFGIVTVSDRSARGERIDESGPALAHRIESLGWQVISQAIIADDLVPLVGLLSAWADGNQMDIILTSGGTGFAPRDITPEATENVIERHAPGLVEAMRAESMKITSHAMLSRATAGIRGRTLIVNLPGSPRGALESLEVIEPVLPHAVELLRENPHAEAGHEMR